MQFSTLALLALSACASTGASALTLTRAEAHARLAERRALTGNAGPYSAPSADGLVRRAYDDGFEKRQQQAEGTPLYLNEPACDFYQCSINVTWGDTMTANWLDPPAGNVILDLMTDASSVVAYNIATVPGTSQKGFADCGFGIGVDVEGTTCGAFSWIIPSSWNPGNYTLRATSESNPNLQSYTDVILLFSNLTRTNKDAKFSTVTISGYPTSTTTVGNNFASTPAPTAPLTPPAPGQSSTMTSAAASSGSGSAAAASGASSAPAAATSASTGSASNKNAATAALPAALPALVVAAAVALGAALTLGA